MATAARTTSLVCDIVGGAARKVVGVAFLQRARFLVYGNTPLVPLPIGMACALLFGQVCVWMLVLGLGHGDVQTFTEEE